MKPRITLLISIALIVFVACQKMVDWKIDPVTKDVIGDTALHHKEPSGVLARMVATSGGESITTIFTYDSLKHLVGERRSGTVNGSWIEVKKVFTRDTLNRIIKVTTIKNNAGVVDTLISSVYYDEDNPMFIYSACSRKHQGQIVRDSSIYVYDGNGHVGIINTFQKLLYSYNDPVLKTRSEFAYANNNLISSKTYRDSSGTMVLAESTQWSYDNRVSPLKLYNDAFLIGRPETASLNNSAKFYFIDAVSANNNSNLSTSYFYGGSGKPLSGAATAASGAVSQLTYFYE